MSYNTIATFKIRAHPSGSYNDIPDAVITTALDSAGSLIDSSLRIHHALPMATGSYASELASIYDAEAVIASYRLMQYRGFKANFNGEPDEFLNLRYLEIMDPDSGFLVRVANGQVKFPAAADNTPLAREGRSKAVGTTVVTGERYDSNGNRLIGF